MCIINICIWVGLKRGSSPKHIFLWGKWLSTIGFCGFCRHPQNTQVNPFNLFLSFFWSSWVLEHFGVPFLKSKDLRVEFQSWVTLIPREPPPDQQGQLGATPCDGLRARYGGQFGTWIGGGWHGPGPRFVRSWNVYGHWGCIPTATRCKEIKSNAGAIYIDVRSPSPKL